MTGLHARPQTGMRRARMEIITEESVYGTVLVSGMIVATGAHGATAWQVFLRVFGTVVVFWAAHVYAGAVAGPGVFNGEQSALGVALKRSLRRSMGFLTSALPPSFVLLWGALRAVDDDVAIWVALWLSVVILAVVGLILFTMRGASWPVRIFGALGTATFGVAMILLKAFIH